MLKMYKVLPNEFDFVPKTWIMPSDYSQLLSYSIDMKKAQQKRTFILKPSNAAMGHGIKLYRNIEKIQPTDNFVVQEYISNPYLLDKYKFDLRIYALVTSCDPLRAFIFNNGLVRLGTEKYQEPHESNIVIINSQCWTFNVLIFNFRMYLHKRIIYICIWQTTQSIRIVTYSVRLTMLARPAQSAHSNSYSTTSIETISTQVKSGRAFK